ncbi:MAG TPA: DUF4911 domain-containing protein [Desulfobacteraceae bacterium]|nr:DUF4911 domain-containing protein [Desulfobacteraceae bacterium]
MKITKRYYRIDRREICFLRFILEAYEGIAVLTTIDPALGIVMLTISSGCEKDVEMILHDLKKDFIIEQMESETLTKIGILHDKPKAVYTFRDNIPQKYNLRG